MPCLGSFQNIDLLNLSPIGLTECETMWFKLGKNQRSSTENQLTLTK